MKGLIWVGALVSAAIGVVIFGALALSIVGDAHNLFAGYGWWALLALSFPAAIGLAAWFSD